MHDLEELGRQIVGDPPLEPLGLDELSARARRQGTRRRLVTATASVLTIALIAFVVTTTRDTTRRRRAPADTKTLGRLLDSTLPVGEALGVAADTTSVWVAGVDVVRRIDPRANAVVATIPVPGSSDVRSVSIGNGSVWVTDTGTERVTRIDPVTNQVIASIAVPGSPTATAAAGGAEWVALPNPTTPGIAFVPIDPASNTLGPALVQTTGGPDPFPTMDTDGDRITIGWNGRAWNLDPRSRTFIAIDPTRLRDVVSVTAGGLAIDRDHRLVRLGSGHVERSGATIPGAFKVADGGGWGWVLARRDASDPPKLYRVDTARLRTVGHPVVLPSFPGGIATQLHTVWVATDGALVRVDLAPRPTRPDLCPSPVPLEYLGADALRPLSSAITEPDVATAELASQRTRLEREYPDATAFTVGPGYGRGWQRERGSVVVGAVDDLAIIAHFPGRNACPNRRNAALPIGDATTHDVPVLLAADGPGAAGVTPIERLHLRAPAALTVDPTGHLLVCDTGRVLRRLDDGTFERIAGTGRHGFAPDGTPALDADINCNHLTAARDGTLYYTEGAYVRAVTPTGRIRTIAGDGSIAGYSPDGTLASGPALTTPVSVADLTVAPDGRLWIAGDAGIQYLDTDGDLHTWRAGGLGNLVWEGQPALFSPGHLAIDPDGSVWVWNFSPKVLVHFTAAGQILGEWDLYLAQMIIDPSGGLIVADHGAFAIEHIASNGTITTLVPSNPGPGLRAFRPESVTRTPDGTLYATSNEIADPPQFGMLEHTAAGTTRVR